MIKFSQFLKEVESVRQTEHTTDKDLYDALSLPTFNALKRHPIFREYHASQFLKPIHYHVAHDERYGIHSIRTKTGAYVTDFDISRGKRGAKVISHLHMIASKEDSNKLHRISSSGYDDQEG